MRTTRAVHEQLCPCVRSPRRWGKDNTPESRQDRLLDKYNLPTSQSWRRIGLRHRAVLHALEIQTATERSCRAPRPKPRLDGFSKSEAVVFLARAPLWRLKTAD